MQTTCNYLSLFFHGLFPEPAYPWVGRVAVGATILLSSVVPGAAVSFFLEFLGVSKGTHMLGRRHAVLSAVRLGIIELDPSPTPPG